MLRLTSHLKQQDYITESKLNHRVICEKNHFSAAMQDFFKNPDEYMANTPGPFFKNTPGEKSTIAVVQLNDRAYVIKRYNLKNRWHALKVGFRGTRAVRAWYYAHYLLKIGIPTIKPVALLEQRKFGGWRGKAYLIAEYKGGTRGCRFFREEFEPDNNWQSTAKAIADIIARLKQAKLSHSDLHVGNMLILDRQPYLIDLDHMHHHPVSFNFQSLHRKDVKLFFSYLQHNLLVKDFFAKLLFEHRNK